MLVVPVKLRLWEMMDIRWTKQKTRSSVSRRKPMKSSEYFCTFKYMLYKFPLPLGRVILAPDP
jgi:hypothetical protein